MSSTTQRTTTKAMSQINKTKNSACDPGPNRTLLAIGQDLNSIQEYITSQSNYHHSHEDMFIPPVLMVYTDIQHLKGLDSGVNYGSGIEDATTLSRKYPNSGLQIGLWLNGTKGCQQIMDGMLDQKIQHLFDTIQKWNLPKIFLRIGYEFDNPYFGYSDNPMLYQQSYRKIIHDCEIHLSHKTCHSLIAFVWHSWAAPRLEGVTLEDFYPGTKYVDWIGISIFQQLYPWASSITGGSNNFAGGNITYVKEVLEFATQQQKPIMIAESTPFGGMKWNGTTFHPDKPSPNDFTNVNVNPSVISSWSSSNNDDNLHNNKYPTNIWNLWFEPLLRLIDQYDIRMWSYINCHWNAQKMWYHTGFGDTRLSISEKVMNQWNLFVLNSTSRFLSNAPLKCHDDDDEEANALRFGTTPGTKSTVISNDNHHVSVIGNGIRTSFFMFKFERKSKTTLRRKHYHLINNQFHHNEQQKKQQRFKQKAPTNHTSLLSLRMTSVDTAVAATEIDIRIWKRVFVVPTTWSSSIGSNLFWKRCCLPFLCFVAAILWSLLLRQRQRSSSSSSNAFRRCRRRYRRMNATVGSHDEMSSTSSDDPVIVSSTEMIATTTSLRTCNSNSSSSIATTTATTTARMEEEPTTRTTSLYGSI